MLCAICYHLYKDVKKTSSMSVTFSKVTLPKKTLQHGCFSSFLNCTNGIKSQKASHILQKFETWLGDCFCMVGHSQVLLQIDFTLFISCRPEVFGLYFVFSSIRTEYGKTRTSKTPYRTLFTRWANQKTGCFIFPLF